MTLFARLQHLLLSGFLAAFFPLSIAGLIFNYACVILLSQKTPRRTVRRSAVFKPKTILLTGIGSPQGLRIARAFYETGHTVIGADLQPLIVPTHASFSRALRRFYRIQTSPIRGDTALYSAEILSIIQKEDVELWISCFDSDSQAVEAQTKQIVERKTRCLCFIIDVEDAAHFARRDSVLSYIQSVGLPVPETYVVKSRSEIHNVLNDSQGKRRYTLNAPNGTNMPVTRTILPRRTLSQTYQEISSLKVGPNAPMVLKQHLEGLKRYNAVSIVVRGRVKLYTATDMSDRNCSEALPPTSALSMAMLQFVQALSEKLGTSYSAHLCVSFCVDERLTDSGIETFILPVDASSIPQSSLSVFTGLSGSIDLSRAYLSIFSSDMNGIEENTSLKLETRVENVSMPSQKVKGVYSFGLDFVQLLLKPIMSLVTFNMTLIQFYQHISTFLDHLIFWQEGLYDISDPLPSWWLYQVYYPIQLLIAAVCGVQQNIKD